MKKLGIIIFSSSSVLGLIVGISVFMAGKGTFNANVDYDFGATDGFLFVLGLPIVATLVFVLLSPVSYFVYKLLSARDSE